MDAPILVLVRHAQATGQEPDAALTPSGQEAASRLADRLATEPVDVVVSSPFRRAEQTARTLAATLGRPVWFDARLVERRLTDAPRSDWTTLLETTFHDPDLRYPGGESSREATRRALGVVADLHRQGHRRILLVTHGNLLALVLQHFRADWGFECWRGLSTPDVFRVEPVPDGWRITRLWQEGE